MSRIQCLLMIAAGVLIGGCSQYMDGYYYSPRPAISQVPSTPSSQPGQPNTSPPAVTAMAAVIGVRWSDDHANLPETVEIRLQLENNDGQQVTLDPKNLRLSNNELAPFGQAVLDPPQVVSIAPQQSAVLDLLFPLPAGHDYENTDLNALTLRWTLSLGDQQVGQVVNFSRVWPQRYYYQDYDPYWNYDPYWYYPHPYVGGVIIVHRRW